MAGKFFIISAPSGAGKTTLIYEAVKRIGKQCNLQRLVTYTSRTIRTGEENGKDYHFLSEKAFREKIDEGFFIEYSTVYKTYYGSPKSTLKDLKKGISYIAAMDYLGALNMQKLTQNAVLIWVKIVNMGILQDRLTMRGSEEKEAIKVRHQIALEEIEKEQKNNIYKYQILNDNFEKAVAKLTLIIKKELLITEL